MKRVVVVLVLVLAGLFAATSAQAFVWHLAIPKARAENERFARDLCESDRECTYWAGSKCQRVTESRVDCIAATWYPEEPGYETQCWTVTHWGVNYSGYIVLKNRGPVHCELERA